MKVIPRYKDNEIIGYRFHCPGCECSHIFYTKGNVIWSFNGDLNNPTFSPSLLNTYEPGKVCHLFVSAGKIQFLNDSFHNLKGQTIDMIEEPEEREYIENIR